MKWSLHIYCGIIFPTMGSCNTVLGSKGKRRKVNKDFISRKKKLIKSKWWKSSSFALMKVSGYTNWGSQCNWNIMMTHSCTKNREMFWLIKENESKISVDREKCQMTQQTCCAQQKGDGNLTRVHFALDEWYWLRTVCSAAPSQLAEDSSFLESRASGKEDCRGVYKAIIQSTTSLSLCWPYMQTWGAWSILPLMFRLEDGFTVDV